MRLLAIAALAALPILAQSEVGTRVSALTLVDSSPGQPKTVGTLDVTGAYVVMYFTRPVLISVSPAGVVEGNAVLYYDIAGCVGNIYTKTPPPNGTLITRPLVLGPQRTVYLATSTSTTSVFPHSRYSASGGCQNISMASSAMTPVAGVGNLYDIFVPPFKVVATTY